jgi:Dyp-type peroxidase family
VGQVNVGYLDKRARDLAETRLRNEKRKQQGVAFPSAREQEHLLVIRFDLSDRLDFDDDNSRFLVRLGLKKLCSFFDSIDKGIVKMDQILDEGGFITRPVSGFNFTSTIGFGIGFFEKLNINERNRPRKLKQMPDGASLGDLTSYSLSQTDFIIQLCCQSSYVNRWVFRNFTSSANESNSVSKVHYPDAFNKEALDHIAPIETSDIYAALSNWAKIIDTHAGFQRLDGRNLLGFNDGISNPDRLSNNVIWLTEVDEHPKFKDGTYMVFQKIEHDLEKWQTLSQDKQERWIGRSKETGLLLGTLSRDQDRQLALEMHSDNLLVQRQAVAKWRRLYKEQQNPDTRFFSHQDVRYKSIQLECPVWSHVRKANPRQADGARRAILFRRGYLYIDRDLENRANSGLLFICFQRDIEESFEYIKQNFLNNKDFPVPKIRGHFDAGELAERHQHGRLTNDEIRRSGIAFTTNTLVSYDTQNTGREGLSGPSELGVFPDGQFPIVTTLGGGYYFVPPIPNKKIADISEQFFD